MLFTSIGSRRACRLSHPSSRLAPTQKRRASLGSRTTTALTAEEEVARKKAAEESAAAKAAKERELAAHNAELTRIKSETGAATVRVTMLPGMFL